MVIFILTMIVKNESKIIKRCLDAARFAIDAIVITDTGSSDNTVELINDCIKEFKIPGRVVVEPWRNFGYNRSKSFLAAKQFAIDQEYDLAKTYTLFLDADMELVYSKKFLEDKAKLTNCGYLLDQITGDLRYANQRIACINYNWRCRGRTHEFWDPGKGVKDYKNDKYHDLWIDDKDDGGAKADKFERDIRLLTEGLEHPEDEEEKELWPRYHFYLAQSYRSIRDYANSDKWYKQRIKDGDFYEEVYFSFYQIAENYASQGNWCKALKWYLKAYNNNPRRAEPLYKIAHYYRNKDSKHQTIACDFARLGIAIPYPKDQMLFIEHKVYDYLLLEELSITGFYVPKYRNEGLAANDKLTTMRLVPNYIRNQAEQNKLIYADKLGGNPTIIVLDYPCPAIKDKVLGSTDVISGHENDNYKPLNPSIIKTETGYLCIYRTVNYTHDVKTGSYQSLHSDGGIRTRNLFLSLTNKFDIKTKHEIVNNLSYTKYRQQVLGLEDCRLFQYNNKNYFTCTTLDTNPTHAPQITLCRLGKKDNTLIKLDLFTPLIGPDPNRCEKNWIPFADNGICVIYGYDPLTIYNVNENTGVLTIKAKYSYTPSFANFRGGAGLLPFDLGKNLKVINDSGVKVKTKAITIPGYLAIIHEVIFYKTKINDVEHTQRHYLHRLLWLDKTYNLQRMSKPFYFSSNETEFCLSMFNDEFGNICFGLGVEDKRTEVQKFHRAWIKNHLQPIDSN